MKIRSLLPMLLIIGLLSIPSFAKEITVGEFALKYAHSIQIKVSSEDDAIKALVEKDLMSPDVRADLLLTEQVLVDIFRFAGLSASTTDPSNILDEATVDSAISSLTGGSLRNSSDSASETRRSEDDEVNNQGKKTRPKGQEPNSNANPNAFYSNRGDEG